MSDFTDEELAELKRMVTRGEEIDLIAFERRSNFSHEHDYDHKDRGMSNSFFIAAAAFALSLVALAFSLMLRTG